MINTDKLCMGCMNDSDSEQICPICGHDASFQNDEHALPVRFQLNNRYVVGKAFSANGEGITYIGWDNAEDSVVRIKEYFPAGIAVRNPDTTVSMLSEKKYIFNEGLLEFLDINRTIMRQPLSALQEVKDVFELNGTAYAVYQNIQGITLEDFLVRNGGTIKWEQARALLLPLIDAVKAMNDIGFVHKGISPETIIVGRDGKLRLTDYSIKRLRVADADIESALSDGYSAIEQYGIVDMRVGVYTDVYGLCATLFRTLIGSLVPKATLRLENESMSIPARCVEELPKHVLAALANGLKVRPSERTRNIEALKNELVYGEIAEKEPESVAAPVPKAAKKVEKNRKKSNAKYFIISALVTALLFAVCGYFIFGPMLKGDDSDNNKSSKPASVSSGSSKEELGSVDSDAIESAKLYSVPDFSGKTYAEILDNDDYEIFEITIKNKIYSSKFARGQVCKQTVAAGEEVEKGTKIQVVISLGAQEFKMPKVTGDDIDTAKLNLLKAGFLYENIVVLEKYDTQAEPGKIIDQAPAYGETVNNDMVVKIYKNTYEGDAATNVDGTTSEVVSQ